MLNEFYLWGELSLYTTNSLKQLTFVMHIKHAHYSLTTQNAVYTGTKCIEIALRCEHLHFVIVFSTKMPTLYVNKVIYLCILFTNLSTICQLAE